MLTRPQPVLQQQLALQDLDLGPEQQEGQSLEMSLRVPRPLDLLSLLLERPPVAQSVVLAAEPSVRRVPLPPVRLLPHPLPQEDRMHRPPWRHLEGDQRGHNLVLLQVQMHRDRYRRCWHMLPLSSLLDSSLR